MDKALSALILGPMRLPFLILTPASVVLGTAAAAWSGAQLSLNTLALAFIGAVASHISVNALNEYHDLKSGLDLNTQPTPFSGGSGTLPQSPDKAHIALATGLISLGVTVLVGIYFLHVSGLWLLPVGLLGIIIIFAYTRWITKNPILCLIAPGLGFGPLMVMGTGFVLTGSYSWTSLVASLVPFFLVSNLLLLNQFPDVEADSLAGRRHFPIALGRGASVKLFAVFLACAYATIIIGYISGSLPPEAFLALGPVVLAVPTVIGVFRFANDVPRLVSYMGTNVIIVILTPVLLAMGLFIGRQGLP